jgi:hypothetical protein
MGIDAVVTVPAPPWQNAYAERVIGTLAENFSITSLCSTSGILRDLCRCICVTTILGEHTKPLDGDAPDGRPVRAAETCNVVAFPVVQGLHHV